MSEVETILSSSSLDVMLPLALTVPTTESSLFGFKTFIPTRARYSDGVALPTYMAILLGAITLNPLVIVVVVVTCGMETFVANVSEVIALGAIFSVKMVFMPIFSATTERAEMLCVVTASFASIP